MEVSAVLLTYAKSTDKATVNSTDTNFPELEARCERRGRNFKGGGKRGGKVAASYGIPRAFYQRIHSRRWGPLPLGFGLSRGVGGFRLGPSTSM